MKKIVYVDRDTIIDTNSLIIATWNACHPERPEFIDVSTARLDEVLDIVRNVGNDLDFDDSVLVKAAHLAGGLAWDQCFSGANKRTAMSVTSLFLQSNGFDLFRIQKREQRHLRQLLFDIQEERGQLNERTMSEIILYIKRNVRKL